MADWRQMRSDAELDAGINYAAPTADAEPGAVLLTGATGFLGAYLLDELLRRTDAVIHCLVRAADQEAAAARLRKHLRNLGLWREEAGRRVVAVAGDLSRPRLGLAEADYRRLAHDIDTIYHNGAWINALLPYADLKAVNVEGTREILRFAGTVRTKPVHYLSTLALFFGDAHARHPLAETDIPVLDEGLRGGYKQTKWVAEQLVRNAQARGLPAAIHRPGRILGHSQTGVNSNLQDVLCTVLKGCVLLGKAPDVDTVIDLTPVDYVSRAIVHLARSGEAYGRAFHLCNPRPIAWNALMDLVRDLGHPLESLPYPEWVEALRRHSAQNPGVSFYRQLRLLLRSPIYLFAQDKPLFSADATHRALAAASIDCPRIDRKLMAAYFAHFRQCGYLPDPEAGAA